MNKKYLIYGFMFLIMVSFVTAAWFFVIQANINTNVVSIPGYASLLIEIPQLNVNTTNGPDSVSVVSSFIVNKDITLNTSIVETYQDNSGGECNGGEDDCIIEYMIQNTLTEYTEIINNEVVFLEAINRERNITVTMSCVAYSCPQSRNIDIILTEVLQ